MATKGNPFKFKLRTATVTMDYDGGLAEGIEFAFMHLAPEARERSMEKLAEVHAKLLAREAAKAAA